MQRKIISLTVIILLVASLLTFLPVHSGENQVPTPSVPPLKYTRTPAEWEQSGEVLLRWDSYLESYYVDMTREIAEITTAKIVTGSQSSADDIESTLQSNGVNMSNVSFFIVNTDAKWMRDYGPISVMDETNGTQEFVNMMYDRYDRWEDDAFPWRYSLRNGIKWYNMSDGTDWFRLEGGNFMIDGAGIFYTTDRCYEQNDPSYGGDLTEAEVEQWATDYFKLERFRNVTRTSNDGTGHIDMEIKLLNETTVLIAEVPPSDVDYDILEYNVRFFENHTARNGQPYNVVRIPLEKSGGTYYAYTNSLIVNRKVLVPVYGLSTDSQALSIYEDAMPGYEIVGIDASDIIDQAGAIHCTTMQVAANNSAPEIRVTGNDSLASGPVKIRADIYDEGTLNFTHLYYNSSEDETLYRVDMIDIGGGTYEATLPSYPDGAVINYFIEVKDDYQARNYSGDAWNMHTLTVEHYGPEGRVYLDRDEYGMDWTVNITVKDQDLEGTGTVQVDIDSGSEPSGETVTLSEAELGTFYGDISLSTTDSNGVLVVSHGDIITVYYDDADNGTGNQATVTDDATVDGDVSSPGSLSVDWWGESEVVLLDEDFSSGTFPPSGWAEEDPTGNWDQSSSSNAGGSSPEVEFSYVSQTDIWRLYAGPINTTGLSDLNFQWDNYYQDYGSGVTVKIQTCSDGSAWHDTGWSITSGNGNVGPGLEQISVNTTDVGSSTFYIGFTVDGNAYQLDYWYVDNAYLNCSGGSTTDDNLLNWTLSPDDGAGENDVDHYNIYRSDSSTGPWDTAHLLTQVPAGTDTYTDTGKGEPDGITWWYVVRAVDNIGNEDTNTNPVPEPGATYDVHNLGTLTAGGSSGGWNFVSFNLDADGDNYAWANDLVEILEDTEYGISSSYDKVMYYSAVDGDWKTYVPGRPSHYNDLHEWNRKIGVWIHMTADDNLTIEGTAPVTTNITLEPGWNMVGYPSITDRLASETLPAEVSKIGVFDPYEDYNVNHIPDLPKYTLTAGEGYWVYNDADHSVVWTVDY